MAQILKQESNDSLVAKAKELMALPVKSGEDIKNHESGSVFVPAGKLHYKGNWAMSPEYAELLDSISFEASGECLLKKCKYVGHFIVSLKSDRVIGNVELTLNLQKHTYDLSKYPPQPAVLPLLLGECSGMATFSLADIEKCLPMKKGLIVHGVMFTPILQ